ncbi:MAG: HAD family hydrolase [Clostridia bacterium]|nr:HAD family hydrolase [Clostridia bacterium]
MYKTVLFDLDGTLTDPGLGITNSVAYALKKYGIEVGERERLYSFIGPPLNESFKRYYNFSDEKAMEAIGVYREYFTSKGIFENEVYDGIRQLLRRIKASGRKVVLATSKPEEFALRILEHFELTEYFDIVAGASMDEKRNKKGDVIKYALEKGGLTSEGAVMIGDREHDIFGAQENGIDTIGVLYGYGSRDELEKAGAMYIAETVYDIFALL